MLGQTLRWRVGLQSYVVALLGPSLIVLCALTLDAGVIGRAPAQWLALGPWGEELDWRGYALPTLQNRWGALGASLAVSLMWFG